MIKKSLANQEPQTKINYLSKLTKAVSMNLHIFIILTKFYFIKLCSKKELFNVNVLRVAVRKRHRHFSTE